MLRLGELDKRSKCVDSNGHELWSATSTLRAAAPPKRYLGSIVTRSFQHHDHAQPRKREADRRDGIDLHALDRLHAPG